MRLILVTLSMLAAAACGPAPTPTTVIDNWEVSSVEGTSGAKIPALKVLQLGLEPDGGVQFVSCLDPVYEGTKLFTCHEQLVCATGSYKYVDSVLTITQSGRSDGHHGTATFSPGGMTLSGEFFGPTYKAVHFTQVPSLSTACVHLPQSHTRDGSSDPPAATHGHDHALPAGPAAVAQRLLPADPRGRPL